MKTHVLKTDPLAFQAVVDGLKTYEIRKNDRDFAVGDAVSLRETRHSGEMMAGGAPLEYTGRQLIRRISHVLTGPTYGLAAGWSILSIQPLEAFVFRRTDFHDRAARGEA